MDGRRKRIGIRSARRAGQYRRNIRGAGPQRGHRDLGNLDRHPSEHVLPRDGDGQGRRPQMARLRSRHAELADGHAARCAAARRLGSGARQSLPRMERRRIGHGILLYDPVGEPAPHLRGDHADRGCRRSPHGQHDLHLLDPGHGQRRSSQVGSRHRRIHDRQHDLRHRNLGDHLQPRPF